MDAQTESYLWLKAKLGRKPTKAESDKADKIATDLNAKYEYPAGPSWEEMVEALDKAFA